MYILVIKVYFNFTEEGKYNELIIRYFHVHFFTFYTLSFLATTVT